MKPSISITKTHLPDTAVDLLLKHNIYNVAQLFSLTSSAKGKFLLSVAVGVGLETIEQWLSQLKVEFPEEKVPVSNFQKRGLGYRTPKDETPYLGEVNEDRSQLENQLDRH